MCGAGRVIARQTNVLRPLVARLGLVSSLPSSLRVGVTSMLLHTASWPEVETYLKTSKGIIIPIGSKDQLE